MDLVDVKYFSYVIWPIRLMDLKYFRLRIVADQCNRWIPNISKYFDYVSLPSQLEEWI